MFVRFIAVPPDSGTSVVFESGDGPMMYDDDDHNQYTATQLFPSVSTRNNPFVLLGTVAGSRLDCGACARLVAAALLYTQGGMGTAPLH